MQQLELVDISVDHAELVLNWRNDPAVAEFLYSDHAISMDEHIRWIERVRAADDRRYWIINFGGVPMGVAGIYDKSDHNRRCSWMFYLANPAARGKGIGSLVEYYVIEYVFRGLGYQKLYCEVLEFNDNVTRLHLRHGFKQECLLRRHIYKNREWHNVVGLALLDDEWEAVRPEIMSRMRAKGLTPPIVPGLNLAFS